ncbi:hypothetical protein ACLB2K_028718 [Fragaria x ananassa]
MAVETGQLPKRLDFREWKTGNGKSKLAAMLIDTFQSEGRMLTRKTNMGRIHRRPKSFKVLRSRSSPLQGLDVYRACQQRNPRPNPLAISSIVLDSPIQTFYRKQYHSYEALEQKSKLGRNLWVFARIVGHQSSDETMVLSGVDRNGIKFNLPPRRFMASKWSPDTSRVRSKMLYASSKDRFKRELDGIQVELQATDPSEMSLDVIKGFLVFFWSMTMGALLDIFANIIWYDKVLLMAVKDFNPDCGDSAYTMRIVDMLLVCVELSYRPEAGSVRLIKVLSTISCH